MCKRFAICIMHAILDHIHKMVFHSWASLGGPSLADRCGGCAGRIGRLTMFGPWWLELRSGYGREDVGCDFMVPLDEAFETSLPAVVGVGFDDFRGISSPRRRALVEGESLGARCERRLWRSIMPIAQALMSTGVRLAARRKASLSYQRVSQCTYNWTSFLTYSS